ncbi:MAG: tRNA glutamyl-Q(34) synthetase GluQRS [Pseudomonadota bacterium]
MSATHGMTEYAPTDSPYRGRFAPTPSGSLHLGSLFTAVASYLDARSHNGTWLIRMDDLDPPRTQAGAAQHIIDCLTAHGLVSDEPIRHQSACNEGYAQRIQQLIEQNALFPCTCSRQMLKKHSHYPHTCHHNTLASLPPNTEYAWRIHTRDADTLTFGDQLQGCQSHQLLDLGGDFVVQRKDALYAYHLASVHDDAEQGITHIVRGNDLLLSTPQHIFLQRQLNLPQPKYLHLPVLVTPDGHKLSKQFASAALQIDTAVDNLKLVLSLLKQPPPPASMTHCHDVLTWGTEHWNPAALMGIKYITLNA